MLGGKSLDGGQPLAMRGLGMRGSGLDGCQALLRRAQRAQPRLMLVALLFGTAAPVRQFAAQGVDFPRKTLFLGGGHRVCFFRRFRHCGRVQLDPGMQRAKDDPVTITKNAGLHGLPVHQRAGAGAEITDLHPAVRVTKHLRMMAAHALVIHHDVISFRTSEGEVIR